MLLKHRLYFTALISMAIWCLLAWNHFNGAVPGHHFLARPDMPFISNWWGALVIPALTWFLLFRIDARITAGNHGQRSATLPTNVTYAFITALIFGATLASFFTVGLEDFCAYMMYLLFVFALFRPVHRAECLLGFVLGMTYTFGAVLPLFVGCVLTLICMLLHLGVRPVFLFLKSRLWKSTATNVAN